MMSADDKIVHRDCSGCYNLDSDIWFSYACPKSRVAPYPKQQLGRRGSFVGTHERRCQKESKRVESFCYRNDAKKVCRLPVS